MTIPQIFTVVGYGIFGPTLAFLALHTFNLIIPGVDYYIPSEEIGLTGYFIALPILVVGFILGMIGTYWEQLHEKWLERSRDE